MVSVAPTPTEAAAIGADDPLKSYMERLIKLIPGEVVGLYLVGAGVIPSGNRIALALWSVVGLVLVVVVRAYATADPPHHQGPQWVAVAVSTVSFVIWVYTMGGPFVGDGTAAGGPNLWISWVGSLSVLVWTFIVPFFYKGD
jgi:hypothetical protein